MCGIVGYIGEKEASDVLLNGLKRLEYRGYDSAGVALIHENQLNLFKEVGKLRNLEKKLYIESPPGNLGIGHTRWATHGRPTEFNAHPHTCCKNKIVIAHNGIIENFLDLKKELIGEGHKFVSETDTEVIAHLVEKYYEGDLHAALINGLKEVHGAYAVVAICEDEPDKIVVARKDSPLVVGYGEGENFVASDIPAILYHTRKVVFLEDYETAVITKENVDIFNKAGKKVEKDFTYIDWNPVMAEKAGYEHFMLKEIFEQPQVIRDTIGGRTNEGEGKIYLEDINLTGPCIYAIKKIFIVACGTAYYSGCVGKYLIEEMARVPVEVDLASEFRYRKPIVDKDTLVIAISQSGETADTLAAIREAKSLGAKVIGIINVKGSTISREVDGIIYIHAGPEIGVASTKAYMAMVIALTLFSMLFSKIRNTLSEGYVAELIKHLKHIPQLIEKVLDSAHYLKKVAEKFFEYKNFLYLGRGINYPIALEGALKLKEISYIHAEAYAAGEMKHGPIALIDHNMPVLVVATNSHIYEKVLSNMQEVKARGGIILALANEGNEDIKKFADEVIYVPEVPEILSPIVNVVPLQLLAYYVADLKGADVDQPRNLAKSVTVE